MNENKITKKELDFCRWYAILRNPKEAAIKSGYTVLPEYRGINLLSKKHIISKIKELEKENQTDSNLVSAGLSRLAFGSVADAVKLILSASSDTPPPPDALDLFNVSEIKFTNGKGMEIKFFDRLKALEQLSKLSENSLNSSALSFYEALERSASGDSNE
jgi:hypothetical protein